MIRLRVKRKGNNAGDISFNWANIAEYCQADNDMTRVITMAETQNVHIIDMPYEEFDKKVVGALSAAKKVDKK